MLPQYGGDKLTVLDLTSRVSVFTVDPYEEPWHHWEAGTEDDGCHLSEPSQTVTNRRIRVDGWD